MRIHIEHPILGQLVVLGQLVKPTTTPGIMRQAPPVAGEDNGYAYGEPQGPSEPEIDELRATGAIRAARVAHVGPPSLSAPLTLGPVRLYSIPTDLIGISAGRRSASAHGV